MAGLNIGNYGFNNLNWDLNYGIPQVNYPPPTQLNYDLAVGTSVPGLRLGGSGEGLRLNGIGNGITGNLGTGGGSPAKPSFWSWDSFIGTKEQPGWGGLALGALSGLGNAFMSMKQYGLAKDAMRENKRQFELNYGAQRDTINRQLEDRQRAQVMANPLAESVESYMERNRIR